jgi:hypothetical protein
MAATPSKAQIVQDTKDLGTIAKKVAEDLKSPELRHLLVAGGKVGITSAKLLGDVAEAGENIPMACAGNPIALAKAIKGIAGVVKESVTLGFDIHELNKANTPEAREKLDQFMRDLSELTQRAVKLEADTGKFAAAAPLRLAMTGRI